MAATAVTPEQPVKVVAVFPVYTTVMAGAAVVPAAIVREPVVSNDVVEATVIVAAETVVAAVRVVEPAGTEGGPAATVNA